MDLTAFNICLLDHDPPDLFAYDGAIAFQPARTALKKTPAEQAADDLRATAEKFGKPFATILADPPWRFQNRTGKVAPEHKRLNRYGTMDLSEICALPAGTNIPARRPRRSIWRR